MYRLLEIEVIVQSMLIFYYSRVKTFKKCIVLNAGTDTRRSFLLGLDELPMEWYATKYMGLHIKEGRPSFVYKGKEVDWSGSFVFTRLRATDQQFCGILYDHFMKHGIPASDPINGSYVNSAEKISQMPTLAEHGVPIPETFIFREESFEKNLAYFKEHITFPCVFKTDGSKGRNVQYVTSWDMLEELVARKRRHVLALVQPFIENDYDTRTIVVCGEVLGSIKRARKSGYLNNIAQGAVPSVYALTAEEIAMAIRAAEVCRIDIAGVDMIHTPQGPIVLEVNKSPQVKGFESVQEIKVFAKAAEILKRLYKST